MHSGEKSGQEARCRNRPSFWSDSSTSDTQRTLCASEHVSQKSVGEKVSCGGKKREHRGDQTRALAKSHLESLPAEDGQREDDGGHAAVCDGDDHDRENFEVVW